MKAFYTGIVTAGVVGLLSINAHAIVYTMDELMAGGGQSITLGDAVFSDFGLTGPIDAADVNVTASITGPGAFQLRFAGAFNDIYSASSPGATDYSIYYSVASISGDPILDGIEQSFNLTALGAGGVIGIGETVYGNADHTGEPVAQSSIGYVYGLTDLSDPLGEALQGDQLVIDPALQKVWVTKDVSLYAAPDGYVAATIFHQGFTTGDSGPPSGLPDGASAMSLMGMAMMGIACLSRLLGC